MHHTKLGRTGLRVSKLCLGTMTFGLQCDVAQSNADPGCRRGGRHRLPRHRRRLSRWAAATTPPAAPSRSSATGCGASATSFIVATKCVGADGTEALGPRHVAQAHPRRDRRLAAAPRHRLCRSLPAARLRPAHADRRGAGGARHGRAQRARRATSACPTGRPTRSPARWAAARSGTSPASTPCSRATTCCSAASSATCCRSAPRKAIAVIPVQSAGRRPADRQARPQGAAAGRHALPARHRRRALPGALLARAGVRDHRRPAPRSPTKRA